jgi:hypothetical protein
MKLGELSTRTKLIILIIVFVLLIVIVALSATFSNQADDKYGVFNEQDQPYSDVNSGRLVIGNISEYKSTFTREVVYTISNTIFAQAISFNIPQDSNETYYVEVRKGSLSLQDSGRSSTFIVDSSRLGLSWRVNVALTTDYKNVVEDGSWVYCVTDEETIYEDSDCRDHREQDISNFNKFTGDPISHLLPHKGTLFAVGYNGLDSEGKISLKVNISVSDVDQETHSMYVQVQQAVRDWFKSKNLNIDKYQIIWE